MRVDGASRCNFVEDTGQFDKVVSTQWSPDWLYNDHVDGNDGGIRFYLMIRFLHNEADISRVEAGHQLDSDSRWSCGGQS